jgi:NitT/TauT family transport system substrate-binding protein
MKSSPALTKLLLFIPLLALLVACGEKAEIESDGSEPELTKIKFLLDWAYSGYHGPWVIAQEKGYFADEGLEVTIERGFGSGASPQKVATDGYQLGIGDSNALIKFNSLHPENPLIGVFVYHDRSPASIVALAESGIKTPKDLEGRVLAIPAGGAPRSLFPLFAEQTGIDADKVTLANVDPKMQQTVLLSKKVDAIGPYITTALPIMRKAGYSEDELTIFMYNDFGLDLYGNIMMGSKEWVEANPETVRAFLRAWIRAYQDSLGNLDEGIEMLAKRETVFDKDVERYRMTVAMERTLITEQTLKDGIGNAVPARLENAIKQVVAGLGLSRTPDISEIFDPQYLPAIEDRLYPESYSVK